MNSDAKSESVMAYKRLAADLKSRIMSGTVKQGEKFDSLKHIARKEGVSVNTAIKAMDLLEKEGLIERVFRKGIFVDAGHAKAHSRAITIGLINPSVPGDPLSNFHENLILPSMQRDIARRKHRVSVHYSYHYPGDFQWEYVPAQEFADCGLSGMITLGLYDMNYLSDLVRLRIPICALDVDASALGIDSVFVDNIEGAYDLTRHFIEAGRKNIIFIGGSLPGMYGDRRHTYDPSALERATGYRLAMKKLAPERPVRIYHNRLTRTAEDTRQTLDRALHEVPDVDAIVSEGFEGHPEIKKRNIPVACFVPKTTPQLKGNVPAVALCDFKAMVSLAVDTLCKRIEDPLRPIERHAVQPEISVVNPQNV